MHILNVAPTQLLEVWDELHSAMQGNNGFGGDVIEFYFFRVMPSNPWVSMNNESAQADEAYYSAACNLHAICRLFEKKHNVAVTFEDGTSLDALLDRVNLNRHRTHLKVASNLIRAQG
jgi:hypothetical protein